MNVRYCKECPYYRKKYVFDKNPKTKHPYYRGQTDLDARPFCMKVGAVILDENCEVPWWCK